MDEVVNRNHAEFEFHQAVCEVLESLEPVIDRHPEFEKCGLIENAKGLSWYLLMRGIEKP